MIVQDNPDGPRRFVMTMDQHTAFADGLATVFGNTHFGAVTDEPLRYVIAHHDAGWKPIDAEVYLDPETGLPYHLTSTPFEFTSKTMRGSPDFNVSHHPFSGLISSMHTTGLLNGRYGVDPPGILARFEGDKKDFALQVMKDEEARQEKLKTETGASDDEIWQAYFLLQFFDSLSLYFHVRGPGQRGETVLKSVPDSSGDKVDIAIRERSDGMYVCDPFPFSHDGVAVSFEGRWMEPLDPDANGKAAFAATQVSAQTATFVST